MSDEKTDPQTSDDVEELPQADYQVAPNAPATFDATIGAAFKLYFDAFGALFWLAAVSAMLVVMANNISGFSLGPLLKLGAFLATIYLYILALQRTDDIFRSNEPDDEFHVDGPLFFNVVGVQVGLLVVLTLVFFVGAGPGLAVGIIQGNASVIMAGTIPGFFVALLVLPLLFFADLSVIFERRDLTESFRRSYRLVASLETWFYTFFILLMAAIVLAIPIIPSLIVLTAVDDLIGTIIVTAVIHTLAFPFIVALSYATFQGLLARAEGKHRQRPQHQLMGPPPVDDVNDRGAESERTES